MAPQQVEKIEFAPGNGMVPEAVNPQDVVNGRAADRARLLKNDKLEKLQKKAPNALKSLDAELKSAPLPGWRHRAQANRPSAGGRKFSWLQGVEKPRKRRRTLAPRRRDPVAPIGLGRHGEERSDEATQRPRDAAPGLLRHFAPRNDDPDRSARLGHVGAERDSFAVSRFFKALRPGKFRSPLLLPIRFRPMQPTGNWRRFQFCIERFQSVGRLFLTLLADDSVSTRAIFRYFFVL